MNKPLRQVKQKYRDVFLSGTGQEVLGLILQDQCRLNVAPKDEETAIRQAVGLEILCTMDLWFGPGQTTSPRHFINKLARGSVETVQGRSKKEKKNV